MYEQPEDIDLIIKAVRKPIEPDGYLWSVIFNLFDKDHPGSGMLLDGLREPLPEKFICIAYLDFANIHLINGTLKNHPFNSKEGIAKLRTFLKDSNPEHFSYARSAATFTAFLHQIHNLFICFNNDLRF